MAKERNRTILMQFDVYKQKKQTSVWAILMKLWLKTERSMTLPV